VTYRPPLSETFPHIRTPWKAIAADLRAGIGRGEPVPGERVPSMTVLAGTYLVNRKTARKALVALAAEGLAELRPGRGYFVAGTVSRPLSVSPLNAGRQRAAAAARTGAAPEAGRP
jgi:DNA-binding GntR family transcriptional regulator